MSDDRGAGMHEPSLGERLRRVVGGPTRTVRGLDAASSPRRPSVLGPFLVGVLAGLGLAVAGWLALPFRDPPPPTAQRRAEAPSLPNASGAAPSGWTVCFTPGGACTDLLVSSLAEARREILVQAYSFTSPPIAEALEDARRRGVRVRVILDDSQLSERYSVAGDLRSRGVELWVDDPAGIAHNKVMILDGRIVVTGSFNFSRSAQSRNAENLLVLRDPEMAARYAENWERRRAVSQTYEAASKPPPPTNDNEADPPKRAVRHGLF